MTSTWWRSPRSTKARRRPTGKCRGHLIQLLPLHSRSQSKARTLPKLCLPSVTSAQALRSQNRRQQLLPSPSASLLQTTPLLHLLFLRLQPSAQAVCNRLHQPPALDSASATSLLLLNPLSLLLRLPRKMTRTHRQWLRSSR